MAKVLGIDLGTTKSCMPSGCHRKRISALSEANPIG
jgi:molecular chaperone DnaK (HSP70)